MAESFRKDVERLDLFLSGFSDDEKIAVKERVLSQAKEPDEVQDSIEQIRKLGEKVLAADRAFASVFQLLVDFERDHGHEHPVIQDFIDQWSDYQRTWRPLVQASRDFADATSVEYQKYDNHLEFIQQMKTKEDLKKAVDELTAFSQKTHTDIPMDYADKLKELGEKIALFQEDLRTAIMKEIISDIVKGLIGAVGVTRNVITECYELIHRTSSSIGFNPILGLFSPGIFRGYPLEAVYKSLKGAEVRLEDLKREMKLEADNDALMGLLLEVIAFGPQFLLVTGALAILANTWAYFHAEALKFALAMKDVAQVVELPKVFVREVEFARGISKPLQEGLEAYSKVIRSQF